MAQGNVLGKIGYLVGSNLIVSCRTMTVERSIDIIRIFISGIYDYKLLATKCNVV